MSNQMWNTVQVGEIPQSSEKICMHMTEMYGKPDIKGWNTEQTAVRYTDC